MSQQELPVFLVHTDGYKTVTHFTLALGEMVNGNYELLLTMSPADELGRERRWDVTQRHSLRHIIDECTAHISGRLVRDFTRRGRNP